MDGKKVEELRDFIADWSGPVGESTIHRAYTMRPEGTDMLWVEEDEEGEGNDTIEAAKMSEYVPVLERHGRAGAAMVRVLQHADRVRAIPVVYSAGGLMYAASVVPPFGRVRMWELGAEIAREARAKLGGDTKTGSGPQAPGPAAPPGSASRVLGPSPPARAAGPDAMVVESRAPGSPDRADTCEP
jgi:hypothetical protein